MDATSPAAVGGKIALLITPLGAGPWALGQPGADTDALNICSGNGQGGVSTGLLMSPDLPATAVEISG